MVTGSLDGSIRLWDKSTGALQQSVDLGVAVTSFHHTGEYIVAGLGSGQVRIHLEIQVPTPNS